MLFSVSLPLVGNGDGFLTGHSGAEAFKDRGANRAKVASRVAGVSRHNSAKEVFCHVLLFSFIVVNINIIQTSKIWCALPPKIILYVCL